MADYNAWVHGQGSGVPSAAGAAVDQPCISPWLTLPARAKAASVKLGNGQGMPHDTASCDLRSTSLDEGTPHHG